MLNGLTKKYFLSSIPPCDIVMQLDSMLAGGLEAVVIDLSLNLVSRGYRVVILVLGKVGKDAEKALSLGLDVCKIPFNEKVLRNNIILARPKVVLSHFSFRGTELYSELNVPFVQVIHSMYSWLDEDRIKIFKESIKKTNLFIAVSPLVKEYSIKKFDIPSNKCFVIPSGIEISKFTPVPSVERLQRRKEEGFSEDDYIFISVASIFRIKRILTLVRSFHLATLAGLKAKLIIIGFCYDKDYLKEIVDYISENNLQDIVTYKGHTPNPEIYYSIADAQIHSSIVEGGQLVLVEALAANLSVITTEVGFSSLFKRRKGVCVVEKKASYGQEAFNSVYKFDDNWELVADLSLEIIKTYKFRIKPDLPKEIVSSFDCINTYSSYAKLIESIVAGVKIESLTTWCNVISNYYKENDSTLFIPENNLEFRDLIYFAAQKAEEVRAYQS